MFVSNHFVATYIELSLSLSPFLTQSQISFSVPLLCLKIRLNKLQNYML